MSWITNENVTVIEFLHTGNFDTFHFDTFTLRHLTQVFETDLKQSSYTAIVGYYVQLYSLTGSTLTGRVLCPISTRRTTHVLLGQFIN